MKPEITIEDFTKLDIRVGTIVSAVNVPETDKLYQLEVDFGSETRQIVSGIADRVLPADIVGKQCPFILNLAPRRIKSVISNGMILAVGDTDSFALFHPANSVNNGASVR